MLRQAVPRSLRMFAVIVGALTLGLSGCGSGLTVSVVRSPDFNAVPPASPKSIKILDGSPEEPHVVVGFVQLRSAKPRPLPTFINGLMSAAQDLKADALIPPQRNEAAQATPPSHNPLRAFFIQDDERGQIVEAFAIRYTVAVQ